MDRGIATFTLDYGKCPPWLFERMVKLGREIVQILIAEYGPEEFIKRIADPVWFQSLGKVLAFDWNASGLTTILTAALKEAIRGAERDLGIFICGGKGKTSLKTPDEIKNWGNRLALSTNTTKSLAYNSKMAAKVDSSLIQDGFQIYHHAFFFTRKGSWTVIQQGMNTVKQTARRYHWHSADILDLVNEPHTAIQSQTKIKRVLDMTSHNSEQNRKISTELVTRSSYDALIKDIQILRKHSSSLSQMLKLQIGNPNAVNARGEHVAPEQLTLLNLENTEFHTHPAITEDFNKSKYLEKILHQLCETRPQSYEDLLSQPGVGPKTIRALSLVSEVIYGAAPSYEDPARYSFAHGGKDATPYPVDIRTYDNTIEILKKAVNKTKLPFSEKRDIVGRLDLKA